MQGAILVSCMGEDTRYGPRTIGEKVWPRTCILICNRDLENVGRSIPAKRVLTSSVCICVLN